MWGDLVKMYKYFLKVAIWCLGKFKKKVFAVQRGKHFPYISINISRNRQAAPVKYFDIDPKTLKIIKFE